MKVVIDLTDLEEDVLETLKNKQHKSAEETAEKKQGINSQSEGSKEEHSSYKENKTDENLEEKSEKKQREPENNTEVNKSAETESKTPAENREKKEDETSKGDKSTESSTTETKLTGDTLRKDILEKCITAFHLCVSRFPTHYKSLYQLAYIYYHSPYHKNLQFARDMLLGTSKWSQLNHMPGQGLFSERKQNNFFQGVWKMPIEEIDRSGSFATHLNRSVDLLLKILVKMKDVSMLYYIHVQMSRSPDSGKKYLRDGERAIFAKEAFARCLDAIIAKVPDIKQIGDAEKQLKYLMESGGKSGQDTGGSSQSDSSLFSPERPTVQTPQKSSPPERNLLMSMLMSPTNSQSSSPLSSSCGKPVSQSAITSPMGSQSSIVSPYSSSNQGTSRFTSASNTPEQQQKKIMNLTKTGYPEPSTSQKLTTPSHLSSVNQSNSSNDTKMKIENSGDMLGSSKEIHHLSESSNKLPTAGQDYNKTASLGVKSVTSQDQNVEENKVSSHSEQVDLELDPVTGLFVKIVPTKEDSSNISSQQEEKSNNAMETLSKQTVTKNTTDSESDFEMPDVVSPQTPQIKTVFQSTLSKKRESVSDYDVPNVVTPNTPVLSATEKGDFRKNQTDSDMKINVYKYNETKPVSKTIVSNPVISVSSSIDVIEILSSSDEERETDEPNRSNTTGGREDDDDDSIPSSIERNLSGSEDEQSSKLISQQKAASKCKRQKSRSDDEGYDPSYMPSSDGSESDSCEARGPAVASIGNPSVVMESPSEFCCIQQPPSQSQSMTVQESAESDSQNSSFVANPEHLYFDINELMDLDD
ncbi:hypothetical protein KUTeg_017290 [Tegillarca granosa]|uniref:Uncharacterized protein n=1 Tax=Tegillarca granosa TaxID=220873 RepID=A0ABQ9ENM9_TEGGR|nr:hypothetical protein KUTeg_017290 [Tegillarca granosa]